MTEPALAKLTEELADLRLRVSRLEDEFAIAKILATYGPAVDGNAAETAGNLWTEDGTYDAQLVTFHSREEITAMVSGDMHQDIIQNGAAHVVGTPLIHIDGDKAVATCYGRLYRQDEGDRFYVWRVTAVR